MVLRGALKTDKCGYIAARRLHDQLNDLDIEILPLTFELIVEACIQADELKDASNYLMHMETSGQTPSSELLDRVMEMYLEHKRTSKAEDEKHSRDDNITNADAEALAARMSMAVSNMAQDPTSNASGHAIDVAGLQRLASRPPPPPPPPPPQPAHFGHPVSEYNQAINPMVMYEMPSVILPYWQPRQMMLPGRTDSMIGLQAGHLGYNADRGKDLHKDLPAFSIPDEFRIPSPDEEGKGAEGDAAADATEKTEPDSTAAGAEAASSSSTARADSAAAAANTAVPSVGGDDQPTPAKAVEASFNMSAEAAEFVPGQLPPVSNALSLVETVSPPGQYQADGVTEYAAAPDSWQYMQQDSHADDMFVTPGMGSYEFSPAAGFSQMGGTYMTSMTRAELEQQAAFRSLRAAASPFVPGALQQGDLMVLPNGTHGQVVGPPVLMPVSAVSAVSSVMPMETETDEEGFSDAEAADAEATLSKMRWKNTGPSALKRDPNANGRSRIDGPARLAGGALAAATGNSGKMRDRKAKASSGASQMPQNPVPPGPVPAEQLRRRNVG
jgi:hypothetical protein